MREHIQARIDQWKGASIIDPARILRESGKQYLREHCQGMALADKLKAEREYFNLAREIFLEVYGFAI